MNISVVVPTIRNINVFKSKWADLLEKHHCDLIIVRDGEKPTVVVQDTIISLTDIMGDYADLIYNYNDGVRNLGFILAKKIGADVIISLDDDVEPLGDTIQDHLNALSMSYPTSWINTSLTDYMRGFPYQIRKESECWVSHGVWEGVPDYDAITQISQQIRKQDFYKGAIPKGILFPCCMMNVAFKIEALPYIYQAPMFDKINRFADIWGGIEMKKSLDKLNKAVVSGFAKVNHDRLSDPYQNFQRELQGIQMNESYGEGEYFDLFKLKRHRWMEFVNKKITT